MRIVHVVGARPNFIKVAPVRAALADRDGIEQVLVHTGQHYDGSRRRAYSPRTLSIFSSTSATASLRRKSFSHCSRSDDNNPIAR